MKGKVISFVNMKGGVGKTTLTINIGHKLSQLGNKVLIVDMDPQFNATQSLLLYKTKKIVENTSQETDVLDEEVNFRQELQSAEYYERLSKNKETVLQIFGGSNISTPLANPSLSQQITDNLYLIPGDLMLSKEVAGDTSNKVGAVIAHFERTNIFNDYQYILIDCPPTWSILTHSSLIASDYYVIPSKVDLYSSIGIRLLEDQINQKIINDIMYKGTGKNLKELGIIFTLVHRNIKAEEAIKIFLKDEFKDIDFFQNDLPYMPSVPTKFILFDDAKSDSKYSELTNSLEKITYELVNKL